MTDFTDFIDAVTQCEALFDPVKHPRDPDTGKFVERPYDVPDEISNLDTEQVIGELAASNEDFAEQVEGIAVDIPGDDEGSAVPTEIQELVDDPNAGQEGDADMDVVGFNDVEVGDTLKKETGAYDDYVVTDINKTGLGGGSRLSIRVEPAEGDATQSIRVTEPTFKRDFHVPDSITPRDTNTLQKGEGPTIRAAEVVDTRYGPKVKLDTPYEAKEAIKDLDWEQTHRSWNSRTSTWDIDLAALDDVVDALAEKGYEVQVTGDAYEEVTQA